MGCGLPCCTPSWNLLILATFQRCYQGISLEMDSVGYEYQPTLSLDGRVPRCQGRPVYISQYLDFK